MEFTLRYEMVIVWSEEDDCYLVHLPDFPERIYRTHGRIAMKKLLEMGGRSVCSSCWRKMGSPCLNLVLLRLSRKANVRLGEMRVEPNPSRGVYICWVLLPCGCCWRIPPNALLPLFPQPPTPKMGAGELEPSKSLSSKLGERGFRERAKSRSKNISPTASAASATQPNEKY